MKFSKQILIKADFYIALFMYAFSVMVLWQIFNTSVENSKLMPKFIFIITFVSATALLVSVFGNKKNVLEIGKLKLSVKELLVIILLFVTYYLITFLGFYTAIFILTVGVSLIMQAPVNQKKVLGTLLYNLILTLILYICFAKLFSMVMPTGIFI